MKNTLSMKLLFSLILYRDKNFPSRADNYGVNKITITRQTYNISPPTPFREPSSARNFSTFCFGSFSRIVHMFNSLGFIYLE